MLHSCCRHSTSGCRASLAQLSLTKRAGRIVVSNGPQFQDFDRNGALTQHEDWCLPLEACAADLRARMTLAEEASQKVVGNLEDNAWRGQPDTPLG